jgi:hypothetical protein
LCLFIKFYLFGFTFGAFAALAETAFADVSTAEVAVAASSLISDAFAEAPFMEQQDFFAAALFTQQAEDDFPLHLPSASQADTGEQYAAKRAATAKRALSFFIKTSENCSKNDRYRVEPCRTIYRYLHY